MAHLWTVDISSVDAEPPEGVAGSRQRLAALVQQRQARLAAEAHLVLSGHAVNTLGKARPARTTYVVRPRDEPAFRAEAERLARPLAEAGLALRVERAE